MKDMSQLLTPHPFPSAFDRVRRSFARQPDLQTCGASAIRHGLLLGGMTMSTAMLEAILEIRNHEGTPPAVLRACLRRLGFETRALRKRRREPTAEFLDRLAPEFARGAFLLPCVRAAEHWVCVGAWQNGRVGLIDSFFDRRRPTAEKGKALCPGLGFFSLTVEDFDALDWAHHLTLVRPGVWERQYRAWLVARSALLRLPLARGSDGTPYTVVQAIRAGAHEYLDDKDYNYRNLYLCLPGGAAVKVSTADPGGDAVGVETVADGGEELVVVRRLGGVLSRAATVPELVLRVTGLRAGQLA